MGRPMPLKGSSGLASASGLSDNSKQGYGTGEATESDASRVYWVFVRADR